MKVKAGGRFWVSLLRSFMLNDLKGITDNF
jgi:hypothetical protein